MSTFCCGKVRVRDEEELEKNKGCVNSTGEQKNRKRREKKEKEPTKANVPIAENTKFY